ncbi:interleukin-17C-like [Styela clava]
MRQILIILLVVILSSYPLHSNARKHNRNRAISEEYCNIRQNNVRRKMKECSDFIQNCQHVMGTTGIGLNITYAEKQQVMGEYSEKTCPEMTEKYLVEHENVNGARSISPYDIVLDYDPMRFPKKIFQYRCLCKGCIDIKTRRENLSLVSKEVTADINVYYYNGTIARYTVVTGCTCVMPIMIERTAKK